MMPIGAAIKLLILVFVAGTNADKPLDLENYLQPSFVDNGQFDNETTWEQATLCLRRCQANMTRVCYYKFVLEHNAAMGLSCGNCSRDHTSADCLRPFCITADGVHRNIISVNRRLPGPSIQVCQGDRVIVDVVNQLGGKTATIHWHGQQQRLSPWMDGVFMGSQCPIYESQTFRYDFIAAQSGTHFWHDHAGLIKEDGVQGPLIVRSESDFTVDPDPNNVLYHRDLPSHTIFLTDWKHFIADDEFPEMKQFENNLRIQALLINGRGAFPVPKGGNTTIIGEGPLTTFNVQKGLKYRFRVVAALCMGCPVELSVDNHKLTVIGVDGNLVKPLKKLDSVVITSGERLDFVLEANSRASTYWIQVRGVETCNQTVQYGLLKYTASRLARPRVSPLTPALDRITINHPHNMDIIPRSYRIRDLNNFNNVDPRIINPPTDGSHIIQRIILGNRPYSNEDFINGRNKLYYKPGRVGVRTTINGITSVLPPWPLHTQYSDIPESYFCSEQCLNGSQTSCICTHKIDVPFNSTVTLIVVDRGQFSGITHPLHLHGHIFHVIAQGTVLRHGIDQIEKGIKNEDPMFYHPAPPGKDTVAVPIGNYAVVRFIADNPGVWIMHCHFIYHNAAGMNLFFKIGNETQFLQPSSEFPRCGSYSPNIYV